MTDKLQGTCSVCLRPMQLHNNVPIRHGFSAVGVRHGQNSGWHTGPCPGVDFPHLGISTDGTKYALGQAQRRLATVEERLRELAGHPDLIWYPRLYGKNLPDTSKPVTLRYDGDNYEGATWSTDGRPTYANEHRRRVVEQQNIKDRLEGEIAAYDRVISTWSPEKYPTKGAPKKIETVHMAREIPVSYTDPSRGTRVKPLCVGRAGRGGRLAKTTSDPSKVTCQRCRKSLGLPAL